MADQPKTVTSPDQLAAATALMQAAIHNPQIPKFYVNSFMNGSSDVDVITTLQLNGQNACVINMSYGTAKGLAAALSVLVATFEKSNKLNLPVLAMATTEAQGKK